jgi:hypothetical protein
VEALSDGDLLIEGAVTNSARLEELCGGELLADAGQLCMVLRRRGAHAEVDGAGISRGFVETVSGCSVTVSDIPGNVHQAAATGIPEDADLIAEIKAGGQR